MLYVYPLSLDFRNGKGRNIGVKVQFMSGEEKEDVCPAIYGKSCSASFLREAWCPVIYHNRYCRVSTLNLHRDMNVHVHVRACASGVLAMALRVCQLPPAEKLLD